MLLSISSGAILLTFCCIYNGVQSDPCLSYSSFDADSKRSVNHLTKGVHVLCDTLLEPQWYRINSSIGGDLVTECPPVDRCGSYNALWMNGEIPGIKDGIVSVSICTSSIYDCCEDSLTIQIKNCGDYRVYYLKPSNSCPQAYCVGNASVTSDSVYPSSSRSTTVSTRKTTTNKPATTTINPRDPCISHEYVHDDVSRSFAWRIGNHQTPRCDSSLPTGWYRFSSAAGNDMVTTCLPHNRCGTTNPVWLAGSIPSQSEGEVIRRVCAATADSCCGMDWNIRIKNCSTYNVYRLIPTKSCPYAYCVGLNKVDEKTIGNTKKTPIRTTLRNVLTGATMMGNSPSSTRIEYTKTTTDTTRGMSHSLILKEAIFDSTALIIVTCILCVLVTIIILTVILYRKRINALQMKQKNGNILFSWIHITSLSHKGTNMYGIEQSRDITI